MSSEQFNFNFLSVINIALKWKKYIIALVAIASVLTAIYAYTLKNNYRAYASFYPASTVVSGRINMFRKENQDYVDYFGIDNELDRFIAIGNSGDFISEIIKKYRMTQHYKIDSNDVHAGRKTYKIFANKYKFIRGTYGNIEVMLEDEDIALAATIVNDVLIKAQDQYRMYLQKTNQGIIESFEKQCLVHDSITKTFTDSLVKLREQYKIYSIISPSRNNLNADIRPNGTSNFAKGVEEIQNIEELKDTYVKDRAKYESLMNEFRTAQYKNIPLIHVIQYAAPGGEKSSPFRTRMVLGALLFSMFLGVLIAVCLEYFKSIKQEIKL